MHATGLLYGKMDNPKERINKFATFTNCISPMILFYFDPRPLVYKRVFLSFFFSKSSHNHTLTFRYYILLLISAGVSVCLIFGKTLFVVYVRESWKCKCVCFGRRAVWLCFIVIKINVADAAC